MSTTWRSFPILRLTIAQFVGKTLDPFRPEGLAGWDTRHWGFLGWRNVGVCAKEGLAARSPSSTSNKEQVY